MTENSSSEPNEHPFRKRLWRDGGGGRGEEDVNLLYWLCFTWERNLKLKQAFQSTLSIKTAQNTKTTKPPPPPLSHAHYNEHQHQPHAVLTCPYC